MNFYRKYYRPGMISLVFLPLGLLFFSLRNNYVKDQLYCIKLNMPPKYQDYYSDFPNVVILDKQKLSPLPPPPPPPPRKLSNGEIEGCISVLFEDIEISTVKELETLLNESQKNKLNVGYKFGLTKNTTWDFIIQVLNLFEKYNIKRSAILTDTDEISFIITSE